MDMKSLSIGPFNEGFIRVATTSDPASTETKFTGEIEILARHHTRLPSEIDGERMRLASHPAGKMLLEREAANKAAGKLVEVPIRMFFNKTANALTVKYQAFDGEGRPVCVGDGCNARRTSLIEGNQPVTVDAPCAGSEDCEFAQSGVVSCRRQVKMPVQIKGQANALSVFEVRTSSFNAYKTLRAQLELIESRFGGLRHVPIKLSLWQASNEASSFEPFDVFKLSLDGNSEVEVMRQAKKERDEEKDCGLVSDQDAIYEKLQNGDADSKLSLAFDDFNEISDFYAPVAIPKSERRKGSQSASLPLTKRHARSSAPHLAADLISSSLAQAGLAPAAEQSTSTQ